MLSFCYVIVEHLPGLDRGLFTVYLLCVDACVAQQHSYDDDATIDGR